MNFERDNVLALIVDKFLAQAAHQVGITASSLNLDSIQTARYQVFGQLVIRCKGVFELSKANIAGDQRITQLTMLNLFQTFTCSFYCTREIALDQLYIRQVRPIVKAERIACLRAPLHRLRIFQGF